MYTGKLHLRFHDLLNDTCYRYDALSETRIATCAKRFSLMKTTSDLRKQLYFYNHMKLFFTKTCQMLIFNLYMMSVNVWKCVTRPLNFGILATVIKL